MSDVSIHDLTAIGVGRAIHHSACQLQASHRKRFVTAVVTANPVVENTDCSSAALEKHGLCPTVAEPAKESEGVSGCGPCRLPAILLTVCIHQQTMQLISTRSTPSDLVLSGCRTTRGERFLPKKIHLLTFARIHLFKNSSLTGGHLHDLWNGSGGGSGEDSLHDEQRKASRLTPSCYCLATRSTRIPNAATIAIDPMEFQNVTTSIPAPNITSDANTSTVVRRFPMDAMMGPHTPKRICTGRSLSLS